MEYKKGYKEYIIEGNKFLGDGRDELTLACYDKAIELDFSKPLAHKLRGCFYMKKRKYAEAMVDFNTAIQIDGDYTVAIVERGLLKEKIELLSKEEQNMFKKDVDNVYKSRIKHLSKKDRLAIDGESLAGDFDMISIKPITIIDRF